MSSPAFQPISPEEYLEAERKATTRSEFVNGTIYAMAGASRWHVLLTTRLAGELERSLRSKGCSTASNDLRVYIPRGDYLYPDIVIYCGDGEWRDAQFDSLENPLAVIEVLSPSTEAYDRGTKFQLYKMVPSIRHFVFVSQDSMNIDAFERKEDGSWAYFSLSEPHQELQVLDVSISLSTIYERVPVHAGPVKISAS